MLFCLQEGLENVNVQNPKQVDNGPTENKFVLNSNLSTGDDEDDDDDDIAVDMDEFVESGLLEDDSVNFLL